MGMPAAVPFEEAEAGLVDKAFYLVHGETDECDEHLWRIAWWDAVQEEFYDSQGDLVYRHELLVIPERLPELPS